MHDGVTGTAPCCPSAVLIAGAPATGKSTLGARLAYELGAAILDLDVVTGSLTEAFVRLTGVTDLSDPMLAGLTRDARYRTLLDTAEANLELGLSVVLVAPFSVERRDAARWNAVRSRLESTGAGVTLVWLHLDFAELAARLRTRASPRDTAKIADLPAYLDGLHEQAPISPHLALDAAAPIPELLAATLQHLGR